MNSSYNTICTSQIEVLTRSVNYIILWRKNNTDQCPVFQSFKIKMRDQTRCEARAKLLTRLQVSRACTSEATTDSKYTFFIKCTEASRKLCFLFERVIILRGLNIWCIFSRSFFLSLEYVELHQMWA